MLALHITVSKLLYNIIKHLQYIIIATVTIIRLKILTKRRSLYRVGTSLLCFFYVLCYAALAAQLKFSPTMLNIMLTLFHCADDTYVIQ